jgi:hypothetical protein
MLVEHVGHEAVGVPARFAICANPACARGFFICRRCDRGNRYCSAPCAAVGRAASVRAAKARHQRSEEGREDHREHARASRKRKRDLRVTDQGPQSARDVSKVPPPNGSRAMSARCQPPGRQVFDGSVEKDFALSVRAPLHGVRCASCGCVAGRIVVSMFKPLLH